jgi:hypothetical protein
MTTDTDIDTDDAAIIRKIEATVKRISRLLRGLDMEVQRGALGDLVGMWLGGTFILRDDANSVIDTDATNKVRRELFADWCDVVRGRTQAHSDMLTEVLGLTRDRN